jgi:5'-methylthioadenosine phosphorylase
VGSMKENIQPGEVVIPDQFIDFTKLRIQSFFGEGIVAHVSMADSVCPVLSKFLYEIVNKLNKKVHMGGTYICIEGPQFSSKSESRLFRSWGVDVIGMTNMPEAKLAREAEICYSTLALCTDYDCWHSEHDEVSVEDVLSILEKNTELAKKIIRESVNFLVSQRECTCSTALENAVLTSKDSITQEVKQKYGVLIRKYIQ